MFYVVERVAVLTYRGPCGHYFGYSARKYFRFDVAFQFKQVGKSVQVVNVLYKRKIQRRFDVSVGFVLRQDCAKLRVKLFVKNGLFD